MEKYDKIIIKDIKEKKILKTYLESNPNFVIASSYIDDVDKCLTMCFHFNFILGIE